MTSMIFDAVKMTGKRALVSKGWGGLGADDLGKPEGVFMLGNCPHDWLFKRVSAVVHHGGAGTTAAGIAAGRPTVVIPFFGDQPFWGAMVARAGAGPDPIPYKDLTAEKLAGAINEALKPESLDKAHELSNKIKEEDGCQKGAQSFHQMLNYDEMRCAVIPNHPAVWRIKRTQTKLSAKAATVLAQQGEVNFSELKLFRAREYVPDEGPWDPISGAAGSLMGTATSLMMGVADMPIQTLKLLQIHPDSRSRKGKEKATGSETPSTGEQSRTGRPETARTTTRASGPATERFSHRRRASSISAAESKANNKTQPGIAESVESAVDTGKGLARIVGAGFRSPMDFSLNIAKGFHNVPKLYGAEVRPVDKVTDLQSGLRTAAKEFGFGLYDGITGIVTDPYKGAKKEGGIGFVKGVGRGLFSVPFRVMGGAWSVPGYAMKGLYQEMIKSKGKSVQNYIIAARIAQGYEEASAITAHEKEDIVSRWKYVKVGIKKKRNPGAEQMDSLHSLVEEKKKRRQERWQRVNSHLKDPETGSPIQPSMSLHGSSSDLHLEHSESHESRATEPEIRSTVPSWRQQESDRAKALRRQQHAATFPLSRPPTTTSEQSVSLEAHLIAEEEAEQRELERAIAASVAEASRGNPEEDKLVASAIRASIAELERAPLGVAAEDEEELLKRAMQASMDEAGKSNVTEEEHKALEETLRKSLLETSRRRVHGSDSEWNDDSDTEDDEEFQRIIAESKELAHLHAKHPEEYKTHSGAQESGVLEAMSQAMGSNSNSNSHSQSHHGHDADDDAELKKALEESQTIASHPTQAQTHGVDQDDDAELKKVLEESERAEKERMETLAKQKTEEDIVMEYVRKQSLLEEEHRQRVLQGRDTAGEGSGGAGSGSAAN
ncbi:hypothetical protein N0V83_007880 [Neocucurbitaria cava]|uniref:Erythromycin biosynthesis protein CIII-like C-terminal domain-containing protein n=1 Tax=Neocucurbitaria cava TaxID=798079 RepID=A0A9W8Y3M5_9PLEO|nr:hypothetical protein N0V83_007880 [Neocucurbitaria cava]